jgi:hypothetical protein
MNVATNVETKSWRLARLVCGDKAVRDHSGAASSWVIRTCAQIGDTLDVLGLWKHV